MKNWVLGILVSVTVTGCGTATPLSGSGLAGMAAFEAMGADDVVAMATKTTLRKQMREALETSTRALLKVADRDPEDGRLSFDELRSKLPGFSREAFNSKDKDEDGALAMSELVTDSGVSVMTDRVIRIRAGCIKALDKDRDRRLSRKDLQDAKQFLWDPQPWSSYAKEELESLRAKLLKDAFASRDVDADRDQLLDYDELYALFRFAIARGALPQSVAKPNALLF